MIRIKRARVRGERDPVAERCFCVVVENGVRAFACWRPIDQWDDMWGGRTVQYERVDT
jgi:hypothetical protein